MVMTRAQFARDLQDGLNAHFGMTYDERAKNAQWKEIFEQKTSKKAYEEQVLRVGLGEAKEKSEGSVITFDTGAEGWVSRVQFTTYALAIAFTEEAIDDNLYADLGEVYSRELAKALQHAKEVRGAEILNNAIDANFPGGDGKPLAATDHPLYGGGAFSNRLAVGADASEEALEDLCIMVDGFVNDRGRPIVVKPKKIVCARQQMFEWQRILRSNLRVGTANNDINAIKDMNYIPGGYVVNHYLRDPDAFFLINDVEYGLQYWQRKGVKKGMEVDFKTGNLMYKVSERFGFSWADPRCIAMSPGG